MIKIYTRENPETMREIRTALLAGERVQVSNAYETIYGVGFDKWLRDGISDIPAKIETSGRQWEYGYPFHYDITPINEL